MNLIVVRDVREKMTPKVIPSHPNKEYCQLLNHFD